MDYIAAIVLFAISASVTPGPNNIMVMTSGVNFGVRKSIPLLSGICVGFALMVLLVGLGFGQLFELFPALHLVIKCLGTAYLLYLAWMIAHSGSVNSKNSQTKPLSFIKGALFQWINGKAWVVATGAIAAFTTVGAGFYSQSLTLALTFLLVSFPCVSVWLLFGTMLKQILKTERYLKWFNYTMSALLVLSVIPVMQEIIVQVL
jgi:threonine/homoserine/homoserine lactone efflux protein